MVAQRPNHEHRPTPEALLEAARREERRLLDNAAKYTASTVFINTWRDRNSVVLQVLDEGEGIPQGDLEHIFDKFYRVQKTGQVRPGTGLGLAISLGFVEAMNGTVVAANRSDRRGAVCTITLPFYREQPQEAAA